ncbi:protein FAR1-RELATED SEQUENCE 6-like [Tasmannia lanceolata]|uniref:protein FAR1-RELATED SEQUENCE 6-like n=1 Tax=Tasmannia lanceolata TaxID=3420 RepID=UPI004063EAC1
MSTMSYHMGVSEMDKNATEINCGTFNTVGDGEMNEKSSGRGYIAVEGNENLVPQLGMEFEPTRRESISVEGNANFVPQLGMEFESPIAAHSFYNNYAELSGFATKIKSSNYLRTNKELRRMIFACTKEGYKKKDENIKNPRPETREGCLAMMGIRKKTDSENWVVIKVVTEHTHILSPAKNSFQSHSDTTPAKKRAHPDHEERVRTKRSFADKEKSISPALQIDNAGLSLEEGVKTNRPNSDNFLQRRPRHLTPAFLRPLLCREKSIYAALQEGDVQTVLNSFKNMQIKNPSLIHAIGIGDDGRLRNIFWADAKAKASYSYFGDVIMFASACLTINCGIPFASFVGVNHHGQSMVFGCGLLADETKEAYSWLFKTWLQAMSDHPPISIITEQSFSIQAAIAEIFPTARHRVCEFHIMKKFPEKLGPLVSDDLFLNRFRDCIYDSLTVEEFRRNWLEIIKDYKLAENEWLNMLYEDRGRWVPMYLKDTFFAGISATHLSESVNAFFVGFVHPKTSLKEFVERYELAVENQCQKEAQADFNSFHMKPSMKTKSFFEKDAANVYTSEIFSKFQDEICGMPNCSTRLIEEAGAIVRHMVIEIDEGDNGNRKVKEYEVQFDASKSKVHCICRSFEFQGYLCKHALVVLVNSGVNQIPSRYILSRWRKDAKRVIDEARDGTLWRKRYDDLCCRSTKFAQDGALSEHTYVVALNALDEAWNKVRQANDSLGKVSKPNIESVGRFSLHTLATFQGVTEPNTKSIGKGGENSTMGINSDQNVDHVFEANNNQVQTMLQKEGFGELINVNVH